MTENATLEKTESQLDKSAIREFAVSARRKLKEKVELQANKMGFFSDNRAVNYEFEDDRQVKINGEFYDKKQVNILKDEIRNKTFDIVIDEVAYTWFNRFIALYYMEIHCYIENGLNVISSIDDLNQTAIKAPNYLKNIDREKLFNAVQENNSDEVYKELIITQCNELNKKLPFLFEEIKNYTELLFPAGMMNSDSVIREMLALDKKNWDEVEIIGWLYQYYIVEKKDEVFADLKKGKKILKENIPAATQIFTPKWIVQYMVENSVGKLWLESHPNNNLEDKFKYFLKSVEQEPQVKAEIEKSINKYIKPEEIKVLDPACGSGHILVSAFEILYEIYKSAGYLEDEIASLILKNNLYGLDICDRASQLAQLAVIMKAREYDKNISNKVTELNITSIQETNWIDKRVKECLMNGVNNKLLATSQIELLTDTFNDAKEYGSIIDVKDFDFDFWQERLNALQTLNMGLLYIDVVSELQRKLPQLIKQATIMQQKYECVISNPPYMGNKGMDTKLTEYVKDNYRNSKTDFFAIFMEKNYSFTINNGYTSMITQPSWLFLSSFEELRKQILDNQNIMSVLHMGRGIFGIDFGSCAFTLKRSHIKNYIGSYFRLHQRTFQYINPNDIANLYLTAKENHDFEFDFSTYKANQEKNTDTDFEIVNNDSVLKIYFEAKQNGFHSIPGSPIAYWASDRVREIFLQEKPLKEIGLPRVGLQTSDNNRFLRLWHEVNFNKAGFNILNREVAQESRLKWFPYNKGGDFRKWYGNNEYLVNWENDGNEIREYNNYLNSTRSSNIGIANTQFYFNESITWSFVSSTNFGIRYSYPGFIFDTGGSSVFVNHEKIKYLTGLLCSKLAFMCLKLTNPTLNFQPGNVGLIPTIITDDDDKKNTINCLVNENIKISKDDWDSFETSWDFETHPLIRFCENPNSHKGAVNGENISVAEPITMGDKIEDCFNRWREYKQEQFNKLKANEEELNRLFIEIYGLQDEMNSTVADKDITVSLADELREVKSLLSYAVGCILGRYSLDNKGLTFAGGTFDHSKYMDLEVDEDGIIPILADTWFEDDIIDELKRFLSAAFGAIYLTENLKYIANVLKPNSTDSCENIIRNYFLKDFYKDHLQIYKKRPIYWMFTSGKEKAFNCLVYLHRYDKTTLSRIRKDYLHEYQAKLDRAISQAEDEGNVKLTSIYAKYKKELQDYDAKIKDLADAQIELDLDDGVKVNYGKFKGLLEAEKEIAGKEK